jgi:hypothetical protein
VPYTEVALGRVDRAFGIKKNGGADQFKDREGRITIQDCTDDIREPCELEPIIVTPDPEEDYDPCDYDPASCYSGGGGWPGTGGGGGGTDGNGGSGSDEAYIGTEEETDGNCPRCGEKAPTAQQDSAIREAIEKVQCESMKGVLQERLPYLKVFTEQPAHLQGPGPKDLGYHANGVIYIYEGLWKNDAVWVL